MQIRQARQNLSKCLTELVNLSANGQFPLTSKHLLGDNNSHPSF